MGNGSGGTIFGAGAGALYGSLPGGVSILVGLEIGATLGALLDAVGQRPDVNRTGDARWSGSTYGTSIVRGWGKNRTDVQIVGGVRNSNDGTYLFEFDEGGKKGPATAHYHTSIVGVIAETGFTFPDGTQVERKIVLDRLWAADIMFWQNPDATAPPSWSSSTTYNSSDYVLGSDNQIYWSLADSNTNHDPTVGANQGVWWQLAQTTTGNPNLTLHPGPMESTFTQAVDSFWASYNGLANTSAMRGLTYFVLQDWDTFQVGNQVPQRISAEWHYETPITDADILSDLLRFSGLGTSDIDVSLATPSFTGFQQKARSAVSELIGPIALAKAYDLSMIDGKVWAIPRGGDIVATIPDDDLCAVLNGDKLADRVESTVLADRAELPSMIQLLFYNEDQYHRQYTAPAVREGATDNSSDIQTALVMTGTEGAQTAGRLLDTAWLEEGAEHAIYLPGRYKHLAPSDPIEFTWRGVMTRFRIERTEYVQNFLKATCVRDELEVLNRHETADGNSPTPVTPPAQIRPTTFYVCSPAFDPSDALAASDGFYVFANGPDGWTGCQVDYTWDAPGGGRDWISGPFVGTRSSFGLTTSHVLPDAGSPGYDASGSDYTRYLPAIARVMGLSDSTQSAVNAGTQNAILGDGATAEILGIVGVDPMGTNQKVGPGLIRGMRSSVYTGHALGETLACAPDVAHTTKINVDHSKVGATVYVRAYSPGQTRDDSPEHTCVISAATKPFPVNGPPVDPSSISVGTPQYAGLSETIAFTAVFTTTPPAGQTLNWWYSTNGGSTWTAGPTNAGNTYTPPAFTSGTMEVRCEPYTQDGRTTGNYTASANQTYAAPTGATAVDPDSVSATVSGYAGATELGVFAAVFTTHTPTPGQTYQSQYSTDAGRLKLILGLAPMSNLTG